MDIQALYTAAAVLHGHRCPGLAIGVRAAVEACGALRAEPGDLSCLVDRPACWTDGIRSVLGAAEGNGRLRIGEGDSPAFHFTDRERGKTLTLLLREPPQGLDKAAHITFILSAEPQEVFFFQQADTAAEK